MPGPRRPPIVRSTPQTPTKDAAAATRAATQPTTSMAGWNALTHAIAADLPTALHRASLLHAAALRELH